jgi:hypothetical protein
MIASCSPLKLSNPKKFWRLSKSDFLVSIIIYVSLLCV